MPRLRQPPGEATREGGRAPEYLEVLARGVRVMECFRDGRNGLSVSDVAKRVGIPRASARRALLTLADLGYVEDQGRAYALTPKVLTLASAFLTSNAVATVMQPIVESVAREIGEACSAMRFNVNSFRLSFASRNTSASFSRAAGDLMDELSIMVANSSKNILVISLED